MTAHHQPELPLALHVPMIVLPQGDGSIVLKPGKPQEFMTVLDFARRVGLSRNSIYDYIGSAALPDAFIRFAGTRRILISAAAVEHWETHWRRVRGIGLQQS